jgi:hypothetical protein
MGSGLAVEQHDPCNAKNGVEFACMRNRDSSDFMNQDKFQQLVLRMTKSSNPYEWDLLDETGRIIVKHIVEDDDQGLSKEWGLYGWYHHPLPSDIAKAALSTVEGKTVYLSPTDPV